MLICPFIAAVLESTPGLNNIQLSVIHSLSSPACLPFFSPSFACFTVWENTRLSKVNSWCGPHHLRLFMPPPRTTLWKPCFFQAHDWSRNQTSGGCNWTTKYSVVQLLSPVHLLSHVWQEVAYWPDILLNEKAAPSSEKKSKSDSKGRKVGQALVTWRTFLNQQRKLMMNRCHTLLFSRGKVS